MTGWQPLRAVLFLALLLAEAVSDARTREVPDALHGLILLAALPGREWSELPGMLAGALCAGGLFLAAALRSGGRLGGADVKLAAASGFFLGAGPALAGLCAGLMAAVLAERVRGNRKEGFPLIPYLAPGLGGACLMMIGVR